MSSAPIVGVHPIFTSTTIITSMSHGLERDTATGFFFSENSSIYLVTNKHVIYGENYDSPHAEPQIDQIRINLHTNPNNFNQNEEVTIGLFDGGNRRWLEHSHPHLDIVLIPINLNQGRYFFHCLDRSYLEPQNILAYFEKIFVIGYPRGFYDNIHNLPIVRIGHLSSAFRVPFREEAPYMLGDVETHEGMSGSPVLMDLKDYITIQDGRPVWHGGRRKFTLIGICSGQYRIPNLPDRPNLIVIWFPEFILEIANAGLSRV